MKKPNISPGPWAQPHDCPHHGIENMQANAQAIAAVPELLEALEQCLLVRAATIRSWNAGSWGVAVTNKAGYTF